MLLKDPIFRAYDIRGEVFVDFDEDGFMAIAEAFGVYVRQKHKIEKPRIFVSGDGRESMPELYPAVISGLLSAQCNVVFGGAIPTPINYFVFRSQNFDAAIQISASHNPANDNGLKLTDRFGAVCGEEIQKIKKLAKSTNICDKNKSGQCEENCKTTDFLENYKEKLKKLVPTLFSQKIVLDAGNGIAGMYYPEILEFFGQKIDPLFCDLDTRFPNHQPDPERPENLKKLQEKVLEIHADFGFAYDGDGDRLGIVLQDGKIISADKIFYVLAVDFLSRNPSEKIVLDAMSSQILIEKITQLGGNVILSPTGHSNIEQNMHQTGARLGGEQSGHFMFGEDFYGHDDACLASLRFLFAVQKYPHLMPEITENWPKMLEFSEKFFAPDDKKFEIMKRIGEHLQISVPNKFPEAKINMIDGVRIEFGKNEWAIIRCSNTSPRIAVRIEANDETSLNEKKLYLLETLHVLSSQLKN